MITQTSKRNSGTDPDPLIEDLLLDGENRLIVVVSDFHMGEGFLPHKRRFSRTENFFNDEAFEAFLEHLQFLAVERDRPVTLIINGDFLDFIRIRAVPGDREHRLFRRYIRSLGQDLRDSEPLFHKQEYDFGLGSQELKSTWKLQRIAEGHPRVFRALADFIVNGNQLILVKGNHDLEFYWPRVRREFHKILARHLPSVNGEYRHAVERMKFIRKNVLFVQKAVIIDRTIYIEHGHQYMPITRVEGPPVQNGELTLPPGSILNRYLINAIESMIPFINNINPLSDVFKTLGLKQKLQALRILIRHLPITGKILYRQYRRDGLVLLAEILPHLLAGAYTLLGFVLPLLWDDYAELFFSFTGSIGRFLVRNWFLHLSLIVAAFATAKWLLRFIGRTHHFDIKSALQQAKRKTAPPAHPKQDRFLVLGHIHRPEVHRLEKGWWYVNSGTWAHVISRLHHWIPMKHTMSYVQFEKDRNGVWDFELLQWNENVRRPQKLILLE